MTVSARVQNLEPETAAVQDTARSDVQSSRNRLESMGWLPCTLSLDIPLVRFTIDTFLKLSRGDVRKSACSSKAAIPVQLNGKTIATSDIETVGDNLAFRIT